MKYLFKYNQLLENKAVDQLVAKYAKQGKAIDPSDMEYFKKITKKLPNNLPKLVKWALDGYDIGGDIIVPYEYYMELREKNLKVPDINQFESPEDLYDYLQEVENNYKVNKMVQEFPSNLKRQYKKLEDKSDINNLLQLLSDKDTKNELIKKISRYKSIDDLKKVINDFLSSSEGYRETLLSLKNDPNVDLVYYTKNIIVAQIKDFKASCSFGSKSWCISTSDYYFKNYTSGGEIQYFIWDFNLPPNNRLSMIGVTTNSLNTILNTQRHIRTAHDRFDRYISDDELVKILKDKNIPLNTIYLDLSNITNNVLNILSRQTASNVIKYLDMVGDKQAIGKVFKYFIENKDSAYLFDLNLSLYTMAVPSVRDNSYLNERTLDKYFYQMMKQDPFQITYFSDKYSYSQKYIKYLTIASEKYLMAEQLLNLLKTDSGKNSSTFVSKLCKLLLDKIKKIDDLNKKVTLLTEWEEQVKPFIVPAKIYLINLSQELDIDKSDLSPLNKFKLYVNKKDGYKASEMLNHISYNKLNEHERDWILYKVFKHKPLSNHKEKYIDNIIDFMKEFEVRKLTELMEGGEHYFIPAIQYFGRRVYDMYDIVDHAEVVTENHRYYFALTIFNSIYQSYIPPKPIEKYIRSEIGIRIVKDYILTDRKYEDNVIVNLFRDISKKQLKDHRKTIDELIDKILEVNSYHTLVSIILVGNEDQQLRTFNSIKSYFNNSFSTTPIEGDVIFYVLSSDVLSLDMFKKYFEVMLDGKILSERSSFMSKMLYYLSYFTGDDKKLDFLITMILNNTNFKSRNEVVKSIYYSLIDNILYTSKGDIKNLKALLKKLSKYRRVGKEEMDHLHEKQINVSHKEIYKEFKKLN